VVQGFEVVQDVVVVAPLTLMPEYVVAERVGYTMGGLVGEPPALTFVSVGVVDPYVIIVGDMGALVVALADWTPFEEATTGALVVMAYPLGAALDCRAQRATVTAIREGNRAIGRNKSTARYGLDEIESK
jgi:hypothetical protein